MGKLKARIKQWVVVVHYKAGQTHCEEAGEGRCGAENL